MTTIRLAIVSKRKEIARFLELEATGFRLDVSVFDRYAYELGSFDACVIDLESIKSVPQILPPAVLLIDGFDRPLEKVFLSTEITRITSPIQICDIDSFYSGIAYKGNFLTKEKPENASESRIYFCKDRKNTVRYNDRYLLLSDYEIVLLEHLCKCAPEPVSRAELNALFGAQKGNIADVYVCHLRKKLESTDGKKLIFTVRSYGYKIMAYMEWE
ncbi:MAG: winged helix-turn-helix transcriptional regulator [Clostridia bacterium]|nr:winged helix-turn-helix transcriptional regulator [Clostridia bacterium]